MWCRLNGSICGISINSVPQFFDLCLKICLAAFRCQNLFSEDYSSLKSAVLCLLRLESYSIYNSFLTFKDVDFQTDVIL